MVYPCNSESPYFSVGLPRLRPSLVAARFDTDAIVAYIESTVFEQYIFAGLHIYPVAVFARTRDF